MERRALGLDEVNAALRGLSGWRSHNGRLHREFRFDDFSQAFGFMARVALLAERMNHHPDWSNVYNRVTVELYTHDAGGITALDLELAEQIDKLVAAGSGPK